MGDADRRAIASGLRGSLLMERAGAAVAAAATRMTPAGARIAVLCGPGNNGGDGFVAARLLQENGYHVSVFLLGERQNLKGDASLAARGWTGEVRGAQRDFAYGHDLIIDALFGAGLDRPIEGEAASLIDGANESGLPILAVDLPSGVDGGSGAILGRAVMARESVTFFRYKPGHLLLPGRLLAGPITLADIGHDPGILEDIRPAAFHNDPAVWIDAFPRPMIDGHKYDRGHTVVVSGPLTGTGAARLAARAALRIGSGLVTVASPPDAIVANAAHLTAIMLTRMYEAEGLAEILADRRKNAVVIGPALGVGDAAISMVSAALEASAAAVVDADGLTSFAESPDALFMRIRNRAAPVVLTPHEGEFARLFPDLSIMASKLDRAREAALRSGAVVVLKGPDTVVAAPDGLGTIADNAPAYLATAGAGDVLAGIIGGLMAQGMAAFDAATAGVWMHGAAAARVGRGLIAEDIPEALPNLLSRLAD
ncbi:MAG: NAD(P)H-hydrate dehydratase [Bauldia sp.]|uniref:NAD(P)H-hydrate dehydratase n=1 Tax=Bauldia sp. TaxID=2575872 RepID=UPI001D37DF1A|nr:NAD(P)H-hydrate dehydratase [Bauldia sp.]MCB1495002.1 NAD(P)H-hydrate dehydratase [Bauldia sp.]